MTSSPTRHEIRSNYVTVALLGIMILLTGYGLLTLPEKIPIHFNLSGKADRWGSPINLLVIAVLSLLVEGLLWFTDRFIEKLPPELLNIPGPRTQPNIDRQLLNFRQLSATMRVLVAGLFLGLIGQIMLIANESGPRLSGWFMLMFILSLTIVPGVFVVRSYRLAALK